MSTSICCGAQEIWVSNQRFNSLMAFALQVAGAQTRSAQEQIWVEQLRQYDGQQWPGRDLDWHEQFPDVDAKKFWSRIFHDVARAIFLRELGNHEITFWQSSAIGDAHAIARMLTQTVRQTEVDWRPQTENMREADAAFGG